MNIEDLFVPYKVASSAVEGTDPSALATSDVLSKILPESPEVASERKKTRVRRVVQQTPQQPEPSTAEPLQEFRQRTENLKNNISDEMLNQLHHAEGEKNWTAHSSPEFGEKYVTGPLGMVYKYDTNGKVIGSWKEGETCTKEYAIQNAKNHYAALFREWKEYLSGLPDVTQDKLDALVAASDGTVASKNRLKKFVKEHWGDWNAIDIFWRKFATTAAGNGKQMPGLVLRRQFEADWFKGVKRPFSWYQKNRKQFGV